MTDAWYGAQDKGQKMKRVAIIQARMASSRLPDKVLLDIGGEPMLVRVYQRTQRARWVDQVVVATTTDPGDDPIAELCSSRGYPYVRGSATDVLDRYYQAARQFDATVIVRITADCPLIDPDVIDITVAALYGRKPADLKRMGNDTPLRDFAANRLPPPWKRTYPIGLDTEVCTFEALEKAWEQADQPHQREHVMPYLYEEEGRFRVVVVNHEPDHGSLRWTVDTAEDLELVRRLFSHFGNRDDFSWQDVLSLFEEEPELAAINAGVLHKDVFEVDDRAS